MRLLIILFSVLLFVFENDPASFRTKQMNFTRVREAYAEKEKTFTKTLAANSLIRDSLQIYQRRLHEPV